MIAANLRYDLAVPTPSGRIDTRYLDGDDGSQEVPLVWLAIPDTTFTEGTSGSISLLTYLLQPPDNTSVFTLLVNGAVSGMSLSGTNLLYSGTGQGTGGYRIRATRGATIGDSALFIVTALPNASVDIFAPTVPTGLVAGATLVNGAPRVTLVCDPVSDPRVTGRNTSGAKDIRWFRNSVQIGTTTVGPGVPLQLTAGNIGSPPVSASLVQSGTDYTLTGSGSGIGTTDQLGFASVPVTGDFVLIAKLDSVTGGSGPFAGLMVRSSTVAGERMAGILVTSARTRLRTRATLNAATVGWTALEGATWPIQIKLTRAGDVISSYAFVGSAWQLLTSTTLVLGTGVLVGLYVVSVSGTAVATFSQVNLVTNDVSSPQFNDNAVAFSTTYTYQAKAADLALNISALSSSISVTTVAQPADTTPPSVPANVTGAASGQTGIVWSASIASDVSGIRGYIWSFSATQGGTYAAVAEQATPNYTLMGLTASSTRWAKIHAIDNAGNIGADSVAVSATTDAVPPPVFTSPTISTITALSTSALRITHTSIAGADHYIVRRSTTQTGTYSVITALDHPGTTVDNTGLAAGTKYWYQVAASDLTEATIGPYSTAVSGTTQAVASSLSFVCDFNAGSLSPGNPSGNTPTVQNVIKRGGAFGMKSFLDRLNSPVSYRTEIAQTGVRCTFHQHCWYGFSVYLPSSFISSPIWELFAQWHGALTNNPGAKNPPISFHCENNTLDANFLGDERPFFTDHYQSGPTRRTILTTLLKDQWMDFVVHVVWAYEASPKTGLLQIWANDVLKVNESGIQIGFIDDINGTDGPYMKCGIYKGWDSRTTPADTVATRTLYHDEVRMAFNVVNGYSLVDPVTYAGPRP